MEIDEKIFFFFNFGIKLVIWMLTYVERLFDWWSKLFTVWLWIRRKFSSLTAILWQWCPFSDKLILNGSSEYSHNLNCKIISCVHNYIKSSRRFWQFCNIFSSFNWLNWLIYIKCMYVYVCECRWRVLQFHMCIIQQNSHKLVVCKPYCNSEYIYLQIILLHVSVMFCIRFFLLDHVFGRGST